MTTINSNKITDSGHSMNSVVTSAVGIVTTPTVTP